MKLILTFTLLAFASAPAFANDAAKDMDPKKQEMMKKMMAAGTPGLDHALLTPMAGSWKYTSKWWESAEAKPQESSGTSTMKLIMGGRYVQHDIKGKVMGMPFQGLGIIGFNKVTNAYETIWLDNMSTGMMRGEGKFDAESKTLKEEGEFSCPVTSNKVNYRSEWKLIDKNNMVFSMYGRGMEQKDKEFKEMEMTFKRTK